MNFLEKIKKVKVGTIAIVLLLLIAFVILQIYNLYMFRIYGNLNFFNVYDHVFFFITVIISLISTLLAWNLASKIKIKSSLKVYIAFLISVLIFALLDTFTYTIIIRSLLYSLPNNWNLIWGNIEFGLFTVHLFIAGATIAFKYYQKATTLSLDLEHTEKEKATLQSQMLQKNLEPHFLFNNLSVLSGLAKKKPEQIEDFIDDFSDVYRYYLKHGKKQLVELKDELSFLKSYISLIEKRFGKAYQINNQIDDTNGFVIPCSLQLCIENAIKHNKANEENPLLISLSRKENTIIIKNKLNKVDFTLGTGTGNDYLKRQYEINFNKEVVFTETDNEFIVEIPLI